MLVPLAVHSSRDSGLPLSSQNSFALSPKLKTLSRVATLCRARRLSKDAAAADDDDDAAARSSSASFGDIAAILNGRLARLLAATHMDT